MESNRIIAEFMGIESYKSTKYTMFVYEEDNHRADVDLHYHTSWDWLMPVISKCYQEHNRDAYFMQHNKHLLESIKNCDIDKAHQIVVGFINQNN